MNNFTVLCSFCNNNRNDADLIIGPTVSICKECVELCVQTFEEISSKKVLNSIYTEITARSTKGHNNFYRPLKPEDSELIRADYAKRTLIPLIGNLEQKFYSKSGTLLATGYERVVIGDYGAYVEFSAHHINKLSIADKFFRGEAKPYQKYWWMESCDSDKVKIYEQIRPVTYADYKPGMFYISPQELFIDGECIYGQ
jgi:hypothetical protein